ncbi:IS21-like element helper ATPase IstB [Methanospirillum stamsii]|uniref:ATP-binding protein n=1 Tax=Methanospirillum stamsii TaxID=1277351 RepID=A0A2V2N061_9EURY|nr:IS21-like element helper ATPase IstB [Methanospirillum stamsii]PWR73109.1 ATP-binding protein [Methanospirillum stamsii]
MIHELEEMCKQLHIAGVYQSVQEQCGSDPEIISVLMKACQFELNIRMTNRHIRTIKQAGFPTQKRFEELSVQDLPDDGRMFLPDLKSLDFIQETKNVVFIGNSGTGKTHLAIATGVCACEHNFKVNFKTAAGLVNELLEAKKAGRFTLLMRQLKRIDLLILDELGYITFDLEGTELLFQILAARYEVLSTVITTNLPFSEWIKVFHDKTLTVALLDRITHQAMIVNMNGHSYRRRAKNT